MPKIANVGFLKVLLDNLSGPEVKVVLYDLVQLLGRLV